MRAQRGASGLFVVVVIALAMAVILALGVFLRVKTNVDEASETTATLNKAATALEQFVSSSGRLPCPADPGTDNGLAVPAAAARDCNFTQGVLPWATIGMRRDDAYDGWGWKISYRVYSNTNGSLTQANGASMVNCDTVDANPQPVDGNGLCPAAHNTLDTTFLAGKGLTVTDFGTTINNGSSTGGAAYVLISHGATGLGAWTAAGVQKDNPRSTEEKNNMKDTGPFTLIAGSGPEVPADDNNHFDDVLVYRTVLDLAKRANLAARDWPDDVMADVAFTQANVAAAGGNASGSSSDTGQTSLTFTPVGQQATTVSGFNSGGAANLGYTGGSNPGLGVVGGGGNNLTSTGGEGIRVDFAQSAAGQFPGKFAVTLDNFGINGFWTEQVEFRFYDSNGTLVGSPVVKQACRTDGSNVLASFSITPTTPGTFKRVEIRPQNTNTVFGFTLASSFIVSEVAGCLATASSCTTQLDTVSNECP